MVTPTRTRIGRPTQKKAKRDLVAGQPGCSAQKVLIQVELKLTSAERRQEAPGVGQDALVLSQLWRICKS